MLIWIKNKVMHLRRNNVQRCDFLNSIMELFKMRLYIFFLLRRSFYRNLLLMFNRNQVEGTLWQLIYPPKSLLWHLSLHTGIVLALLRCVGSLYYLCPYSLICFLVVNILYLNNLSFSPPSSCNEKEYTQHHAALWHDRWCYMPQ